MEKLVKKILLEICLIKNCHMCLLPTAARLSSVSLAAFFVRQDLADCLLEALLDFLANGFAHSMCNILSYLNITNLPFSSNFP